MNPIKRSSVFILLLNQNEEESKMQLTKFEESSYYDPVGNFASLSHICLFCNIVTSRNWVIYQDDLVTCFEDRKKDFKMHLLVITNWHIKNFRFMKQQDIELLEYMKQVGAKVLEHEAPGAK